jgi:hypothetical protein
MERLKLSNRRKQMLNWYRTANPIKWTEYQYNLWVVKVGAKSMKEAIYMASESQLDDLYILREELRLGI